MPNIRNLNPFRRQDENARPSLANGPIVKGLNGSDTKPIDIREKEPAEYKLSEINDSGVFIPPSPPERKSFWSQTTSSRSTASSTRPSLFNENEPFNISRESFDSYRRSFDISARSPVIQPDQQRPRASLDSRTFQPLPRASSSYSRASSSYSRPVQAPLRTQKEEEDLTDTDNLEDVSLEDPKPQPPKKRGVFSRIIDGGSSSSDNHNSDRPSSADGSKSSWHHFGGRKRGQSGQGSELGAIPRRETTPKPVSTLSQPPTVAPAAATAGAAAPPTATAPAAPAAPAAAKPAETAPSVAASPMVEESVKEPESEETAEDGVHVKPGAEIGQTPEVKVDS